MPTTWTRDDAILTMAIYMDRPKHMQVPPLAERERIASILRRDEGEVTDHMWCYARLRTGQAVDCKCGRVWARFREDPVGLWDAADAVMERKRSIPRLMRQRPGFRPKVHS